MYSDNGKEDGNYSLRQGPGASYRGIQKGYRGFTGIYIYIYISIYIYRV